MLLDKLIKMDKPTKTEEPQSSKPSYLRAPGHLLVVLLIFVFLIGVGVYIGGHKHNKTLTQSDSVSTSPSYSMTTSASQPAVGSTVTVSVWEDSGSQATNAVEANISYPTDLLDFLAIDTNGTAFEIQAQSTGKDGQIVIARAHKGNLTGRQLVAKISFKVRDTSGAAKLTFAKGSALVSAVTNKNILSKNPDLNLTIKANQ